MKTILIFLCLSVVSSFSLAIVDGHEYVFDQGSESENLTRAQLFRQLAEELRCPKCQNQNLSDSNAMIAGDLRRELYSQVKAGKTGEDIVDFMVNRYGEFVLYRPAMNNKTVALWYGPVALLLLALSAFTFVIFKRRSKAKKSVNPDLNEEIISNDEQARIDALLNQNTDDKSKGE